MSKTPSREWPFLCLKAAFYALIVLMTMPFLHQLPIPTHLDRFISISLDLVYNTPAADSSVITSRVLRDTGMSIFHPERYHGPSTWMTTGNEETGFFEGWYYKLVTLEGDMVVVIPGISFPNFAFVMFLYRKSRDKLPYYALHRFALEDFEAGVDPSNNWYVNIAENKFSANGMSLSLDGANGLRPVRGRMHLKSKMDFPTQLLFPDVMGWFAWLPMMECRHGIVSLYSELEGHVEVMKSDDKFDTLVLDGGGGYVEKDWGSKFPQTWVWMQCNHILSSGSGKISPGQESPFAPATLMLSVASVPIPLLSKFDKAYRFRGFLGALWLPDHGGVYRFATYNGAVIEHLATRDDATAVEIVIRSAQYRLSIDAASASGRGGAAWLDGPKATGTFEPIVQEMLDVEMSIKLERRADGAVIFNGTGKHGGMEVESLEGSIALLETK